MLVSISTQIDDQYNCDNIIISVLITF